MSCCSISGCPASTAWKRWKRSANSDNPPEVIMISGHGTIETAVRATKLGAYDFLEKPLSLDKTLILVKNAIESKKLRHENVDLKKQLHAKSIDRGRQHSHEGAAAADWTHGADQRPGSDLWRVGHGKRTGGARDPCAKPAQGRNFRRGKLRRDSGRSDRKRTVRPLQRIVSRRGRRTKKASFKKPTAARCFSMKSAT